MRLVSDSAVLVSSVVLVSESWFGFRISRLGGLGFRISRLGFRFGRLVSALCSCIVLSLGLGYRLEFRDLGF